MCHGHVTSLALWRNPGQQGDFSKIRLLATLSVHSKCLAEICIAAAAVLQQHDWLSQYLLPHCRINCSISSIALTAQFVLPSVC